MSDRSEGTGCALLYLPREGVGGASRDHRGEFVGDLLRGGSGDGRECVSTAWRRSGSVRDGWIRRREVVLAVLCGPLERRTVVNLGGVSWGAFEWLWENPRRANFARLYKI